MKSLCEQSVATPPSFIHVSSINVLRENLLLLLHASKRIGVTLSKIFLPHSDNSEGGASECFDKAWIMGMSQ